MKSSFEEFCDCKPTSHLTVPMLGQTFAIYPTTYNDICSVCNKPRWILKELRVQENEPQDRPLEPGEHVHYADPRYDRWLTIYRTLLAATPSALRAALEPSLGTLSSRMTNALFPKQFGGKQQDMANAHTEVDKRLETIIKNLTESGRVDIADPGKPGSLNPLEFDALKAAQEALSIHRRIT